jgi:hypothetical protein
MAAPEVEALAREMAGSAIRERSSGVSDYESSVK